MWLLLPFSRSIRFIVLLLLFTHLSSQQESSNNDIIQAINKLQNMFEMKLSEVQAKQELLVEDIMVRTSNLLEAKLIEVNDDLNYIRSKVQSIENGVDGLEVKTFTAQLAAENTLEELKVLKENITAEFQLIRDKVLNEEEVQEIVSCGDGGIQLGSECFYIAATQKLTWQDARAVCQEKGGDLAQPEDLPMLQNYLKENELWGYYWLGVHGSDGVFKWLNGTPVTTGWARGEPDGQFGEVNCAFLTANNGLFDEHIQHYCGSEDVFICELIPCGGDGFIQLGSECFYIAATQKLTWQDARTVCQEKGGDLAQPEDLPMLQNYLKDNEFPNSGYYWLGVYESEGVFKWLNGTPVITGWAQGSPDEEFGEVNCAFLTANNGLYDPNPDQYCDDQDVFICER